MKHALPYLLDYQWSIGAEGQCPECLGLKPGKFEHVPAEEHGHQPGCPLADLITECGGEPEFRTKERNPNVRDPM